MTDERQEVNYEVMINLEVRGEFNTFKEALLFFMQEVKKEIEMGTSWQVLETTYFLTFKYKKSEVALSLYDARDFAYSVGLLHGEGEVNENFSDEKEEIIEIAFLSSALNCSVKELANEFKKVESSLSV